MLVSQGAFRLGVLLRDALSASCDVTERPRWWRFVSSVPVNPQGKREASKLAALFDEVSMKRLLNAEVLSLTATEANIAFQLSPALPWFDGHFPAHPILPGVAQVHVAARFCEELWAFYPVDPVILRMKFRRILQPGEPVRLILERSKQGVAFTFSTRGAPVSSGVIGFG